MVDSGGCEEEIYLSRNQMAMLAVWVVNEEESERGYACT